jgi:two-component system, sensor histidine kinase PdtaS
LKFIKSLCCLLFLNCFLLANSQQLVIEEAQKLSDEGRFLKSNEILHSYLTKNNETISKENLMKIIYEIHNNHYAALTDSVSYYIELMIKLQSKYRIKTFDEKISYSEGIYLLKENKHDKALQKFILCDKYSIKNKNIEYEIKCNRAIGLLYFLNKNYYKTKKYYYKTINLNKKEEDFQTKILLANCYVNEKQLDSAYILLEEVKNSVKTKQDSIKLFGIYTQYYLYKADYQKSLEFANLAKNLLNKLESKGMIKEFNENLTNKKSITEKFENLFKIGKYDTSKELILEAQILGSKQNKDSLNQKDIYSKLLSQKDSIFYNSLNNAILEIETKYQTEKKEKENLKLNFKIKEKENWIKNLIISLFVFVIIICLTFWFFKETKKQKKIIVLQKAETDKQKKLVEVLYGELHHHIKNNLSIINSFVSKTKRKISDNNTKVELEILQTRIESINLIHEKLYANNSNTLILKETIEDLVNNLQSVFVGENIQIHTNIKDILNIDIKKATPISLIINEFVTNSFKYAFENTEKPLINIKFKEDTEQFILNLSDNGKGLDAAIDDDDNLRMIRLLTQQLDGNIEIKNNNGLQIKITLPK